MRILLWITAVQALNPVVFAWFNRPAGLRILVLRHQLAVYRRKSKKPLLKRRARRNVIHMRVTGRLTLEWTKQQMGNACFEEQPKFLLHDNDGKFGQLGWPLHVECAGKKVSCRFTYDVWLWQEMGIRGVPVPYSAPNVAEHIERLMGTLCRECLDRMLILNEAHLRSVLEEFIGWYNDGRVHEGLNGIVDPDPALAGPTSSGGRLVVIPVLNGLHHDYRLAA